MGGENAREFGASGRVHEQIARQQLPVDHALAQSRLDPSNRVVPHSFARVHRFTHHSDRIRRAAARNHSHRVHARLVVFHQLHTVFVHVVAE